MQETSRIRGQWVAIGLVVSMIAVVITFSIIRHSGRGAAETNFLLLSYTQGLRDIDQGDYAEAVRHLTPVVESGSNPAAFGWRGEAYLQLGQYAHAEADLREAVRRESENPANHAALAEALARQGRFHEALPHLNRALELLESTPAPPTPSVRRWGDNLPQVLDQRKQLQEQLRQSEHP
jgi:tetratricopeptide (TPR) repeat protein